MIMPYFGTTPEWIDLYLYSCSRNKMIDWYFFTDCISNREEYQNVYIQEMSFQCFCNMVGQTLNIDFTPFLAYKLCDLRPFYGFLFEKKLREYEFWGYGDLDIIWGDIKSFYTLELLDKFDVFSTHNDRLSGHFALIRNNDKYRELCFQIKDWKEKLETKDKLFALDESDFSRLIIPQYTNIGKFYRQIMMKYLGWKISWEIYYSVFPIIHFLFGTKRKKMYFKEQHTTPILNKDGRLCKYEATEWYYQNGKLYDKRNKPSYIYLHFMILKKNSMRKDYFWKDDFYHLPAKYNFDKLGVLINKQGIFKF